MIKKATLLLVAFMVSLSSYSKKIRYTDNPLDATHVIRERNVLDSDSLNKMLSDSVERKRIERKEYADLEEQNRALKEYLGKKVPEELMSLAQEVVKIYAENERNNRLSNLSWRDLFTDIRTKKLPVEKDLEKGKLSKDTKDQLNNIVQYYGNKKQECDKVLDMVSKNGAESVFVIADKPTYNVYDTIQNPRHRSKIYNTNDWTTKYDRIQLDKGWEWLDDKNEKKEYKKMKYPYDISFDVYESHPEYYVFLFRYSDDKVVCDPKGNLVFVSMLRYPGFHDLKREILKIEFENNAYDIKSANPLVQHKVKLILGLDKMTASEKANKT